MRVPFNVAPGLDTDDTSMAQVGAAFGSLPPGWIDMDHARFWRGKPQTIGGWESYITTPLTGVCRNLMPWNDIAGTLNIAFGTHTNLEVIVGGGLYDITPAGLVAGNIDGAGGSGWGTGTYSTGTYSAPSVGDYFPRTWALANYGQTLIACPRGGTIYQWSNVTATPAVGVTNAPAKVTFCLVTPQRQIMAFGCNEVGSGTFNPLNIRWSDIEAPTVWTPTTTNNAGEQALEGGGRIVGARLVGDLIFVWTDTALWQGQYIGDPDQTYRFTKLGEHCGLIGPNAVAVAGQIAFWMSPDGNFRNCALGGEPVLMVSPVQVDFAQNLAFSQQDKIAAAIIPQFNEVWFHYPDSRDGYENSRYVGVNIDTGLWLHGTMVRTAFDEGAPAAYPIGVDYSGNVYLHEKGNSADGGTLSWFFESRGQMLGAGDSRYLINGVWPDFQGQLGAVSLTIYVRDYQQSTDRTKGPYVLAPGRTKKDFQADARIARLRFAGNSAPAFCRLGTPEFEMQPSGTQ